MESAGTRSPPAAGAAFLSLSPRCGISEGGGMESREEAGGVGGWPRAGLTAGNKAGGKENETTRGVSFGANPERGRNGPRRARSPRASGERAVARVPPPAASEAGGRPLRTYYGDKYSESEVTPCGGEESHTWRKEKGRRCGDRQTDTHHETR